MMMMKYREILRAIYIWGITKAINKVRLEPYFDFDARHTGTKWYTPYHDEVIIHT